MKRTYEVIIKVNDDVKHMSVYAYSVLHAVIIIGNTMSYERILAVTEISANRYYALKMK